MHNEKIITVHTFTFPNEAVIIRSRLESEGILCFVQDELTTQLLPFYSNTVGGAKLQVKESDAPRAIEILKEAGILGDENEQPEVKKEKRQVKMVGDKPICPFCDSEEIAAVKRPGWLFLLTSLPFIAPSPFLNRKYYCFDCQRDSEAKLRHS